MRYRNLTSAIFITLSTLFGSLIPIQIGNLDRVQGQNPEGVWEEIKVGEFGTEKIRIVKKEGNQVTYESEGEGGFARTLAHCESGESQLLFFGGRELNSPPERVTEFRLELLKAICKHAGIGASTKPEFDDVFNFLENALPIIEQSRERQSIAISLNPITEESVSSSSVVEVIKKLSNIDLFLGSQTEVAKNDALDKVCDIYLNSSLFAKAQKYCESYKKTAPIAIGEFPSHLRRLVFLYSKIGEYSKAISIQKEVVALGQKTLNIDRQNVKSQINDRELLARGGAPIALFNQLPEILGELGNIHFLAGEYQEAEKVYRNALEAKNLNTSLTNELNRAFHGFDQVDYPFTKIGLAYSFLKQGKLEEAKPIVKELLKNNGFPQPLEAKIPKVYTQDILSPQAQTKTGGLFYFLQDFFTSVKLYDEAIRASDALRIGYLEANLSFRLGESRDTSFAGGAYTAIDKMFPINALKQIVQEQNVTLVQYSFIDKKTLNIYVIQPDGKVHFREVKLSGLIDNNPSSVGRGVTDNPAFPYTLVIAIAAVSTSSAAFLLLKNKRGLAVAPVAIALVSGGFLIFKSSDAPIVSSLTTPPISLNSRGIDNISDVGSISLSAIRGDATDKEKKTCQSSDDCLRLQYDQLIAPIAELLPKDPENQVVFVPHLSLNAVPFAALKSPDGRYLIEKHTIRIAPSIRAMGLLNKVAQSKQKGSGEALVVGNPVMPKAAFNYFNQKELTQLNPLPGTEKEAEAIAQLLNTKAILGNQATKTFISERLANAPIVHLATHGLTNVYIQVTSVRSGLNGNKITQNIGGASGISTLAFAPSADSDGLLHELELYGRKFNADLVVLSACDTGTGAVTDQGVVNLARPFLAGGVPSVVVSLWQVPDAPTAELMVSFYKNLKAGQNKAQALRNAMLETMKNHPEPVNWAGFFLVGNS